MFVVTGGDVAPLLVLDVAAFDGVALLVDLGIEARRPPNAASLGFAARDLVRGEPSSISGYARRPPGSMANRLNGPSIE